MANPGLFAPWSSTNPGGETPIGSLDYAIMPNVRFDGYNNAYWFVYTPEVDGKVTIDTWQSTQADGTAANVEAYFDVTSGGTFVQNEWKEDNGNELERDIWAVRAGVPLYFEAYGAVFDYVTGAGYTGEPINLVVRVGAWTTGGMTRRVVHDFEGTAVGQPFQMTGTVHDDGVQPYVGNGGQLYGGDDYGAIQYYDAAGANQHWRAWGVYDDNAATGTRSAFFSGVAPDGGGAIQTSYQWDNSLVVPYSGESVCGLEATFKVDPTSAPGDLLNDHAFNAELQISPRSNASYPKSDLFLTFNDAGIWFGGATGLDATGQQVGPGDLFQGDGSDTMTIDYSRWMTMKLLPTGEYSLEYTTGETLLSGTLVPATSDQHSFEVSLGSGNQNRARTCNWWLDDVVVWAYAAPAPPEMPIAPPVEPIRIGPLASRRRFRPY